MTENSQVPAGEAEKSLHLAHVGGVALEFRRLLGAAFGSKLADQKSGQELACLSHCGITGEAWGA